MPAPAAPLGDEESFDAGMQDVHRMMGRERWEKARGELLALLEEHAEAGYVLRRQAEVVDAYTRCVFYADYEEPELESLISGELLSYSSGSGKVKLRYTRQSLGDFDHREEPGGDVLVHPLTFDSSFSLEVEYADLGTTVPPDAVIGFDTPSPVRVRFGHRSRGAGAWIRIKDPDDKDFRTADFERKPPVAGPGKVALKVTVRSGAVSVFANGRKYLGTKRKAGLFGRIALVGHLSRITSITIEGKTQPSWFENLLDEQRTKAWEPFEKRFRPEEHLPGWLLGSTAEPASTSPPYPGAASPERDEWFANLRHLISLERHDPAHELVDALDPATTDAAQLAFARALVLQARGELEEALTSVRAAAEAAPGHPAAERLLAELLFANGEEDEALATLQSLWLDHQQDPEVVSDLALGLVRVGRLPSAREVLDAAVDSGLHPSTLERALALVAKAENGPDWGRRYEHLSRNYHVISDIDSTVCFESARLLEKSLQRFRADLVELERGEDRRYVVYVFSGQEGYLAYLEDVLGARVENTAGVYAPGLKQLLIWNAPDREDMYLTIRHEGFHQYFDRLVEHAPRWLNEGLAEYYELVQQVNDRWRGDLPNPHHLAVLRKEGLATVQSLLDLSDGRFMANAQRAYAHSWALVHFLRHSTRENRARFDTLIERLVAGDGAEEAEARAFQDLDHVAFDVAWKRYLWGL